MQCTATGVFSKGYRPTTTVAEHTRNKCSIPQSAIMAELTDKARVRMLVGLTIGLLWNCWWIMNIVNEAWWTGLIANPRTTRGDNLCHVETQLICVRHTAYNSRFSWSWAGQPLNLCASSQARLNLSHNQGAIWRRGHVLLTRLRHPPHWNWISDAWVGCLSPQWNEFCPSVSEWVTDNNSC